MEGSVFATYTIEKVAGGRSQASSGSDREHPPLGRRRYEFNEETDLLAILLGCLWLFDVSC
jgi:hypothetical protein